MIFFQNLSRLGRRVINIDIETESDQGVGYVGIESKINQGLECVAANVDCVKMLHKHLRTRPHLLQTKKSKILYRVARHG